LSDQGDETGGGEHKSDIDLRPFLRGEKDRDERPETGLHVGDKENEPVEAAQAARRRRQRWFAAVRLRAGRRRGLVRDPAALISIVAKAG
jgi:hypothetical protein